MAEQVYGTAAREPKNGLPGYGYTFIQMGERPERVFDPAEIASITIFGQTFPWTGWFRWNHRNKGGGQPPLFFPHNRKTKGNCFRSCLLFWKGRLKSIF